MQVPPVFEIVKSLLIPLAIAVVGWWMTEAYQSAQLRNSTTELTQKLAKDLSSEDPIAVMTSMDLLKGIADPETLKRIKSQVKTVQSYKIRLKAKSDTEGAAIYYDLLKTFDLVDDEFKTIVGQVVGPDTIARVDKFSEARAAELDGFRLILEKNYPGAIEKFQKADNVVGQYHNAYEIYRLLQRNLPELQSKDAAVAAKARKSTLETILTKYPQKAPEDFLLSAKKELVVGTVESAVSAAGQVLRTVP